MDDKGIIISVGGKAGGKMELGKAIVDGEVITDLEELDVVTETKPPEKKGFSKLGALQMATEMAYSLGRTAPHVGRFRPSKPKPPLKRRDPKKYHKKQMQKASKKRNRKKRR